MESFITALSSRTPTPGGGAAAAIAAALGSAAAAMACNYTPALSSSSSSSSPPPLGTKLAEAAQRCLQLGAEDSAAFAAYQAGEEGAAARALAVPTAVVRECAARAREIGEAMPLVKKSMASDARVGVHLLSGACRAAWEMVLVNKPPPELKEELFALVMEVDALSSSLVKAYAEKERKESEIKEKEAKEKELKGKEINVASVIGNTPLVQLGNLVAKYGVQGRIHAKLEYMNPGFSKKDRIARQMIDDAVKEGKIGAGQAVVELTSGNTGTGLAIVCACRGIPFVACMSEGNSSERAKMMKALGAEVVLVPQASNSQKGQVTGEDLALVEIEAERIVRERGAFRANQFVLKSNVDAHYLGTAREIANQLSSSGFALPDAFVDFVGTGGTFAGCAKYFKEHSSGAVKCFVIEPEGARVLHQAESAATATASDTKRLRANEDGESIVKNEPHRIQGGGYANANLKFILESKESKLVDGYFSVSDAEAMNVARDLAKLEGIFAGFSSGANVAAALQYLRANPGSSVVVIICDSGLKYLSTDLYE